MAFIRKICVLTAAIIILSISGIYALSPDTASTKFTAEEKLWLSKHKDKTFVLGADPYSGFEYFFYDGEQRGYLIPLIENIEKDLGIKIKIEASKSWTEVYSDLQTGMIDILFGANETPERKEFMAFSRPVYKIPYAIIAKKSGNIHTIGDVDNKLIGFVRNDAVIDMLPNIYKNIEFEQRVYNSELDAINSLVKGDIDAFITSGGPVIYDYTYRFPSLTYAFKINTITSDMTFSTRKENKILAGILDKEIEYLSEVRLQKFISSAERYYYLKIMNLTSKEMQWLKNDGKATVGVTKDYLPFDYYVNGEYKGISGQIIKEISRKTGIKFINVVDDFDVLNRKLINGEIDVLNIAKTEERMKHILYPQPYSMERDIIIGKKDSKDAKDIFGLEGRKVAVIKGFWHYEHLKKNLSSVDIIETDNIQESLELVNAGKADYLIENPSVARYYIDELQLHDLVEKGVTSADSYLYYGISNKKPELASIIDKVIPILDMDELFRKGFEEVPHTNNSKYLRELFFAVIGLIILLIFIAVFTVNLFNALLKKKTEVELLKQREKFLYTDSLTDLHNSNYYLQKIKNTMDQRSFPQTIIICDMNNLKVANDKYGHHTGDELLKLFAHILKQECPEESIIIRIGGDEFYIILENADESKAQAVIASIRTTVSNRSIQVNDIFINASSAFGYATRYSAAEDLNEIINIADERMYNDKRSS